MFNKIKFFLPNLKQAWIIAVFMIIVGTFLTGIITLPLTLEMPEIENSQWFTSITYILGMIPAFIYVVQKGKLNYKSKEPSIPLDKTNIGNNNMFFLFIIFFLILITLSIIIEPLTSWIPMSESMREIFKKMSEPGIFNFITIVIFAPILEEFFMRGVIARGLFYHYNATKGILWSAFIFALIHFNIWQGLGAFCIGAIMGWIYYRTHSFKIVIGIHALNNLFAYIMGCSFPEIDIETSFKDLVSIYNPNLYPFVYIISIVIFALSIYYLNKVLPRKDTFKISQQAISTSEVYE